MCGKCMARMLYAPTRRAARIAIKADGVITNKHGVTLFQRFADCVPIILYDPKQRAIGIVHAGWKGTISGAAASLVKAMNETYSSQPRHLLAGIAPSICVDHYEVGDEVVNVVRGAFKNLDEVLIKKASAIISICGRRIELHYKRRAWSRSKFRASAHRVETIYFFRTAPRRARRDASEALIALR